MRRGKQSDNSVRGSGRDIDSEIHVVVNKIFVTFGIPQEMAIVSFICVPAIFNNYSVWYIIDYPFLR